MSVETQRVISSIESLYSNYQFFGPTARFFKLVEMCASCRPVSCYHFYNPSISLNLLKITHQTWPFILLRHSCTNDPAPQVVKARCSNNFCCILAFFQNSHLSINFSCFSNSAPEYSENYCPIKLKSQCFF